MFLLRYSRPDDRREAQERDCPEGPVSLGLRVGVCRVSVRRRPSSCESCRQRDCLCLSRSVTIVVFTCGRAPDHRAVQAPRHRPPHRTAAHLPHPQGQARRDPAAGGGHRRGQGEDRLLHALLQPGRGRAVHHLRRRAARPALICVVEQPVDIVPIERTREFRGLYHVLGGALSARSTASTPTTCTWPSC